MCIRFWKTWKCFHNISDLPSITHTLVTGKKLSSALLHHLHIISIQLSSITARSFIIWIAIFSFFASSSGQISVSLFSHSDKRHSFLPPYAGGFNSHALVCLTYGHHVDTPHFLDFSAPRRPFCSSISVPAWVISWNTKNDYPKGHFPSSAINNNWLHFAHMTLMQINSRLLSQHNIKLCVFHNL